MDISVGATTPAMATVDEFTLDVAEDRTARYDTLLHKGRRVADVEARIVEAQFRRPDGSTLVLLNDDEPFKEMLTVLLVSPALKELDRVRLGGAFTPGYLTAAYPTSADTLAFCWHDLDQIVTVRRRRRWFGIGKLRWLSVRDVMAERPRVAAARGSAGATAALPRPAPLVAWRGWLRLRMTGLASGRARKPRR